MDQSHLGCSLSNKIHDFLPVALQKWQDYAFIAWDLELKLTRTCILLEGSPCLPWKERAAIHHQIKQLEEEIMKLKAKHDTFGTMINIVHDPFTYKFPPKIASHILQLSLLILNNGERAIHGQSSIIPDPDQWAAPLKLGFVCHKWCQLAWAIPDLWTIVYLRINSSMTTAESLPGLLCEWLGRSGVLPLTIHFFHGHSNNDSDASSEDEFSNAHDTKMTDTLETVTSFIIDILNLHSSQWWNLHLKVRGDILEHFSSSVEPKQLVTLNLTSTIFGESPSTVPKFMVDSELNLTHLKLTQFPLTSINWAFGGTT